MKKKISVSTTVTLVLLAVALTISLTMLLAMRHFNSQLQLVSKRQVMYSHVNDIDNVVRKYYPDMDEELLRQGIAQGYIYGIDDPYAAYYTAPRYEAEKLRLAGKAKNVGIVLGEVANAETGVNDVVVSRVYSGSAAERVGVVVGDVVTALNGEPITGKKLHELQSQINAAKEISVTVRRGEGEPEYPITADEYDVLTVQSTKLDNIGYIKITAFYENTPEQFEKAIATLMEQNVIGFVFDLRNNIGGSSDAVQAMLSQIMPLGAYGTLTDTRGNVTKLSTKVSKTVTAPMVALINGSTAGEAELFAGVLQEANLAHVMGQTSAGKAKCQQYFVLEQDYSAIKMTIGEYGLMKGGSWEGKGIHPAEEVVLPPEQAENFQMLSPYEDAQVQAAADRLETLIKQPDTDAIIPTDPTDPTDTDATDPSTTETSATSTTSATTTTTTD